jgi:hypothetical protein
MADNANDIMDTIKDCVKEFGKIVLKAVVVSIVIRSGINWFASNYFVDRYQGGWVLAKRCNYNME